MLLWNEQIFFQASRHMPRIAETTCHSGPPASHLSHHPLARLSSQSEGSTKLDTIPAGSPDDYHYILMEKNDKHANEKTGSKGPVGDRLTASAAVAKVSKWQVKQPSHVDSDYVMMERVEDPMIPPSKNDVSDRLTPTPESSETLPDKMGSVDKVSTVPPTSQHESGISLKLSTGHQNIHHPASPKTSVVIPPPPQPPEGPGSDYVFMTASRPPRVEIPASPVPAKYSSRLAPLSEHDQVVFARNSGSNEVQSDHNSPVPRSVGLERHWSASSYDSPTILAKLQSAFRMPFPNSLSRTTRKRSDGGKRDCSSWCRLWSLFTCRNLVFFFFCIPLPRDFVRGRGRVRRPPRHKIMVV